MNSKFGSLWRKWDLHIHTDASDGKGTCEEILKEAAAKKDFVYCSDRSSYSC